MFLDHKGTERALSASRQTFALCCLFVEWKESQQTLYTQLTSQFLSWLESIVVSAICCGSQWCYLLACRVSRSIVCRLCWTKHCRYCVWGWRLKSCQVLWLGQASKWTSRNSSSRTYLGRKSPPIGTTQPQPLCEYASILMLCRIVAVVCRFRALFAAERLFVLLRADL